MGMSVSVVGQSRGRVELPAGGAGEEQSIKKHGQVVVRKSGN